MDRTGAESAQPAPRHCASLPCIMVVTIVVAAALSVLAVGLHYESLVATSAVVRAVSGSARVGVALAVVLALVAHLAEVVLFGFGWYALIRAGMVELSIEAPTPIDIVYFSGSVYTSLGFGDVVPVRNGQLLAVSEAVTGLVLIAWTASYTFYEMRAHWDETSD